MGSVGIKSPKLSVYSSMFTDKGVNKAKAKYVHCVYTIAAYIANNPTGANAKYS